MVSAILTIIIGLVAWKLVPDWITEGKKNVRDTIKTRVQYNRNYHGDSWVLLVGDVID